ncbi:MAG: hypothetical protein IPO78_10320 [Saprospiraceae bacterium]|nr:hypothetical protein [Saprospiraceae bacterium]
MEENLRSKRKRTRTPRKFKAGDVFWANETNGYHLTIILDDHTLDNHQNCIPICNFSGSKPRSHIQYVIPLGDYKIPDHYFTYQDQIKPENWIICQPKDCIKAMLYTADLVVGNIKDDCLDLYDLICNTTKSCKIAPRLQSLCKCEDIEDEEVFDDTDCGCDNLPSG